MDENKESSVVVGTKAQRNSIAEKIAALKTNGELNWKKRVAKPETIETKKLILPSPTDASIDQNDNVEATKNNKVVISTFFYLLALHRAFE